MKTRAGILAVVVLMLAASCEESSVPRLPTEYTPTPEDLHKAYSTALDELDVALNDLDSVRSEAIKRLDAAPEAALNALHEARNCDVSIEDLSNDPRDTLTAVLGILADPQLQTARDAPRGIAHELAATHVASPANRTAVEEALSSHRRAEIAGDPTPDVPVLEAYLDHLRNDPAFQGYLDDYDNIYDAYLPVDDKLKAARSDFVQGLIQAPRVSNCSQGLLFLYEAYMRAYEVHRPAQLTYFDDLRLAIEKYASALERTRESYSQR